MVAAKKTIKRIKLSGGKAIVEDQAPATSSSTNTAKKSARRRPTAKNFLWPITAPVSYVKESWRELRQVRWPDRKATWSLTLAVIIFTLFFVLVILVLDAAFQFLFKEVLLK